MGRASRAKRDRPKGPICDFCGLPPKWKFPCRTFPYVVSIDIKGSSEKDWYSCDRCAGLVESRDWDALAIRAVDFYRKMSGCQDYPELYTAAMVMHLGMDANRVGPKELLE